MTQTYTRQSSFSDGDTITAALFNDEYNQLVNAFAYSTTSSSTGHQHDGSTAEGGNIRTIGDLDFLNKIVADSTNNRWGVFVQVSSSAVEQIRIQDGAIVPVTDNDIDLGTSSLEFKDLFIDGTAHVDTLDVDVNGTVAGTFGVTGATTLSSTLAVTGAVTGSSTIQGTTITATTAFVPDASDGAALGTSALEFSDLFLADGAVINFGDDQDITLTHSADTGLTTNGTFQATTITATTAFVPDASDGAALGTSALEFSDLFLADGAVINFGDDQDVSLTHVADTGILLSSTDQLQFGDSGTYIYQSADGVLDLVSDTEIEINATTVDINGNVDISGTLTVAGALDFGDAALSNVGAVQLDSIAGDGDTDTSITFSGSNVITVAAAGANQVTFNDGSILPVADNDIDLGSGSYEFKDAYFDGTVTTDALVADTADINGGTVDGAIIGGSSAAAITGTAITGTSFVIGSADISEAELETIDGVTAGTVTASKAVVVDSNKDIGTIRNLTIDGTFSDGNYTFDTSGNVSGLGTIGSGAITSSGTVQGTTITATTAFVPDASDGAALGTSSLEFSDLFLADGAVINFGDDQDVSLTHVADTGLLISSTDQLQFGDSGTYIYQSADGVLDLVSDTEIEINATTIDINGNVDVSGTLTVAGALDFGDAALSNVGAVQLDSIAGDGDTDTSITFSGSDVITIATGGSGRLTIGDGALSPVTDNEIDLGTSSLEFKDAFFDGTVTADAFAGPLTGNVTGNASGTALTVTQAAQSSITSLGTLTALTVDDVAIDGKVVTMTGSTDDTATVTVGTNGTLAITTVDTAAAAANMTLTADGTFEAVGTTITLDSGGAINLEPESGSAILLDGTISIDAGVVTGATSITSTAFVGDITGDVTGNTSGTAATVTTAAQTNITSLGTLTALTVDDVAIDGKVVTMTGSASDTAVFTAGTDGTLSIVTTDDAAAAANIQITADGTAELAGTTVTLDSSGGVTIDADGGTVTFSDGGVSLGTITSSGYSGTAAVATAVTITDNESTNENNAIIFTAGGDVDGGNIGLESDGDLIYNPSTGLLSSTGVTASGTVTFGSLSDGSITATAFVDEDDMSSDSATLIPTQQSVKAYVDSTGSGTMTSFILEDDDGTEVSISDAEEVKFIGSGLTTNWTDTSPGSDADPFDLTFTVDAAQTGITSIYATDLILGEDSQTAIDFGTVNEIDFKADNAARLTLTSSALYPVTDNEIDLGTASLEFKDAYFDGTVTADAFAGPLTGNVTGDASGTALTVTQAAQSSITSLGTLTTLTVDNVIINGSTIGHTGDTDLMTVASGALTVAGSIDATNLTISAAQGSDGQVLTSTGSGVGWEDAGGGGGASDIDGLSDCLVENDSIWLGNDPSGTTDTASYCIGLGTTALDAITTGDGNTAVGYKALTAATTAAGNTCVGFDAGGAISDGNYNTCVGYNAGRDVNGGLSTGGNNVLVGYYTGTALGAGNYNVVVGSMAWTHGAGGSNNVIIGYNANRYGGNTGSSCAIGMTALHNAGADASSNIAMGVQAGYYISSGDLNVCLGSGAGNGGGVNSHTALTTGGQNVLLGPECDTSAADSANQIVMGYEVAGNADDSLCFGNSTTDSAIAFGATTITAPSDIRLKEDIEDEVVGLDFINELRPVTFRWKKAKDVPEELSAHSTSEKRVMNGKYNHGFISQEVKEVIDNNPDIKEGFDMWTEDEADGRQRIGESALIPMLVKSIQELSAEVENLKDEIETFKS